MLGEYNYIIDKSGALPSDICDRCEEYASLIEQRVGIRVEIHYTSAHGFNVFGERFMVPNGIHIMNFDLSGNCSSYDAWEYGSHIEDEILTLLEELICQISPDGQAHHR